MFIQVVSSFGEITGPVEYLDLSKPRFFSP